MKKILLPTDFSESSGNALEYALAVAKVMNASVDILHVHALPIGLTTEVTPDTMQILLDNQKEQIKKQFQDFVQKYAKDENLEHLSEAGIFIPQEIVEIAKSSEYDLIVMGMKGKHNSMEKLLGSITTQTMMRAPCPVLAIPEGTSFEGINKVAYATDFQLSDQHAVEELMEFAGTVMAEVHFVHVETTPDIGQLKDTIHLENYPYEFTDFTIINHSSITEGLDQYIQNSSIDLLALFIPRRNLWERLFHSSFSKKMSFHTKVPLLVFRD